MNARSMLTTPSPRPWMPLRRRRDALAYTTVRRAAAPSPWRAGRRKPAVPGGLLARLRALFRQPSMLTFRLDELTAEADAWIAELSDDDAQPRR